MKIKILVEGYEPCYWDEIKEAVMKNVPDFNKDSIARPLIELILKQIEFIILSKANKGGKK